jgi:hypothetical protein
MLDSLFDVSIIIGSPDVENPNSTMARILAKSLIQD